MVSTRELSLSNNKNHILSNNIVNIVDSNNDVPNIIILQTQGIKLRTSLRTKQIDYTLHVQWKWCNLFFIKIMLIYNSQIKSTVMCVSSHRNSNVSNSRYSYQTIIKFLLI